MTRPAAFKARFTRFMWKKIEEMGSDPEKKKIEKILYPFGILPKPKKSVSNTDPMKWKQIEKLYPELTRKAHEQYQKDEDVRCTNNPKKVRNPITLENFSKSDVIEERVKQMPPQLTTKKYGKKNGGRAEQTIPKEWIVYNEDIFTEKTFDKENELEKLAEKIKNSLFGKDIIYSGTKKLEHTHAGRGTIPDGYVIILNGKNNSNLWFVEYELSTHDIDRHILPQMFRFKDVFEKENTRRNIEDEFYQIIRQDSQISNKIKSMIGDDEILNFLRTLIDKEIRIKIVIDKITDKLIEGIKHAPFLEIQIIELRKFENKDGKQIISLKELSR